MNEADEQTLLSMNQTNDTFDKYFNKELINKATSYLAAERHKNGGRVPSRAVTKIIANLTRRGIKITVNALSKRVRPYKTRQSNTGGISFSISSISIVNTNDNSEASSITNSNSHSDPTGTTGGRPQGTTNFNRDLFKAQIKQCINEISVEFAAL